LVVRLAGNREVEGRKLLARWGMPIIRASTLAEAAERVVHAAQASPGRPVALSS